MNTPLIDRLLKAVDVEDNLLPYLKFSGWEQVDDPRWIVVQGDHDADNRPLEVIFPKEKSAADRRDYVLKAVELLTALKDEPMQLLLQNVVNYDRDLLYVKNTEAEEENAISLKLAVDQVNNLKRTIEYSACSERLAKPYFLSRLPVAQRAIRDFLFGHTFAGSFGFTIETPRLPDPPKFIQQMLPLGEDYSPPPVNVPFDRRVMERIVRGLNFAKQAEREHDPEVLVREYASGFNSNMCSAIVGISQEKQATIEFRVVWSPKVKPGEDVSSTKPIKLRTDGYDMLEYAANKLKSVEPEFVKIAGHVRALTASDNPLSLGTRRAIVVRGTYPGIKRAIEIVVELDREGYAEASRAHLAWQNIQVSGILARSGVAWRLLDARDFIVIS